MYSASYIASLFVARAIQEGNPITQMKLQKILYFAQGYHLAVYDSPLFKEAFQAWQFGPVVPIIYDDYKLYGNSPIVNFDKYKHDIPKGNDSDPSLIDTINYTWGATKDQTATSLSAWTHEKNAPWQKVYNPNEWAIPIKEESIKEYFKDFLFE